MATDRLTKYIWIVDTITRHKGITRSALSELWLRSPLSDGQPLPHRTFFAMRRDIEQQFGISIKCNGAHEYYIDSSETVQDEAFRSWVLDTYSMNSVLADNRDIAHRIHVEPIPSARQHLPIVISAMREGHVLSLDYAPFNRSGTDRDILLEPYFIKLFRQRWYVVGRRRSDAQLRTYALDRITRLSPTADTFTPEPDLSADSYFADLFGITQSKAAPCGIRLRVAHRTAKYLRALPLHQSQREEQFSDFSIFNYRMKLTDDLVRHMLSLGPDVEVLSPPSLRLMLHQALKDTIAHYEQ